MEDSDDDLLSNGLSCIMKKPSTNKREDSDSEIEEDNEFSLENLFKTEQERRKRLAIVLAGEEERDKEEINKRMFMDETPEETKALDAEVSTGAAGAHMFNQQEDDGPPPKGFFDQTPLAQLPNISPTDHDVIKIFFSSQSSQAWDNLFGSFTCAAANIDLPKLKLTDRAMVDEVFMHLREAALVDLRNTKRGLRALKQVDNLEMQQHIAVHSIRFACYANSLHCEVELSSLVNSYTTSASPVEFAHQVLPFLIQENDMNGNLFRFCRVGKLFMPQSYHVLKALVNLFVDNDEWYACWNSSKTQRKGLTNLLFKEVNSRPAHMQCAKDFHRWYSILTLIEFQLRWIEDNDNEEDSKRAKVCHELKLCKKQFNQSGLLSFLNMVQYLTDICKLYC